MDLLALLIIVLVVVPFILTVVHEMRKDRQEMIELLRESNRLLTEIKEKVA